MTTDKIYYPVFYGVIAVGILVLIVCIVWYFYRNAVNKRISIAEAEVTEFKEVWEKTGRSIYKVYRPVIKFSTDTELVTSYSLTKKRNSSNKYTIHQKVTICYDTKNPEKIIIAEQRKAFLTEPIAGIIVAIFIIVIGIGLMIYIDKFIRF